MLLQEMGVRVPVAGRSRRSPCRCPARPHHRARGRHRHNTHCAAQRAKPRPPGRTGTPRTSGTARQRLLPPQVSVPAGSANHTRSICRRPTRLAIPAAPAPTAAPPGAALVLNKVLLYAWPAAPDAAARQRRPPRLAGVIASTRLIVTEGQEGADPLGRRCRSAAATGRAPCGCTSTRAFSSAPWPPRHRTAGGSACSAQGSSAAIAHRAAQREAGHGAAGRARRPGAQRPAGAAARPAPQRGRVPAIVTYDAPSTCRAHRRPKPPPG